MSEQPCLLDRVGSFENLFSAFRECSKGKKSKDGYRKYLFAYGEKLKSIEREIQCTNSFRWGGYREFFVHDPKKRLVMAAPFRDRIVHTAIHRVIDPIVNELLGARTFACRKGMGNRKAAERLLKHLKVVGRDRYCVKLDVKKYFESIPHEKLFKKVMAALPDPSLRVLLESLIASHERYRFKKRGIPIGNLTSQLFANFYLREVDQLICARLGISHTQDPGPEASFYIRYMDDMVIVADGKQRAFEAAHAALDFVHGELELEIPQYKVMPLAGDPIPFLGFVHSELGYRPLRRNELKFIKKIKRLNRKGAEMSLKAQMIQSFEAWQKLEV
jgi:hypothetical protein